MLAICRALSQQPCGQIFPLCRSTITSVSQARGNPAELCLPPCLARPLLRDSCVWQRLSARVSLLGTAGGPPPVRVAVEASDDAMASLPRRLRCRHAGMFQGRLGPAPQRRGAAGASATLQGEATIFGAWRLEGRKKAERGRLHLLGNARFGEPCRRRRLPRYAACPAHPLLRASYCPCGVAKLQVLSGSSAAL